MQCQIRVSTPPEGLRLEAAALAGPDVSGTYRLQVTKENAAGSSQNEQSGDFSLMAGQEQVLTVLVLERAAIGHYHAKLLLDWKDGQVSCEIP